MPFFYSQYLKEEKIKGGWSSNKATATKQPKPSSAGGRRIPSSRRPSLTGTGGSARRLVWHSNTGASGKRKTAANFKYKSDGKKVVHFSTIEVQPFHFDWTLAGDVFYSRKELTSMGQSRFDDAAKLRQQRHLDEKKGGSESVDDVGISTKSKTRDIATLLTTALEDEDRDENVSIRGIEHFVYPDLQQEMIRRKKEVQREVLEFVRSKRPDPQGWRLAQHSRSFSQWARNVALEKGMKYCMNNATVDPDVDISDEERQRMEKSTDELEATSRTLRGSNSFSASPSESGSFDLEPRPGISGLQGIAESDKPDHDEDEESDNPDHAKDECHQSAGMVDTGEH